MQRLWLGSGAHRPPASWSISAIALWELSKFVQLGRLKEAGKVTPVIDRTYPLSETSEAIRYLGEGHARGKVVVTV